MTVLRADLHVHTCHSRHNDTLAFLGVRDCYSTPEEVYTIAKGRGMDLVAITDHDTIEGALALVERMPGARDIIVGEEVSCWLPESGLQVHLGVYGMTESLHHEIQPLRRNVFAVAARLREASVFFALNHLLHFYEPRVSFDAYLRLLDVVPGLEVRNGTMISAHNRLSEQLAAEWRPIGGLAGLAPVAGSDAHTLRRVGTTWTEAPGCDRDEFLSSVRAGLGRPGGREGSMLAAGGDAYGVIRRYIASLAGLGQLDHSGWHRAACLGFAAGALPFQFLPLAIASKGKLQERRKVRAFEKWMTARLGWSNAEATAAAVRAQP